MIHPDSLQVHVDIEGETVFAGRVHFHRSRGGLASSTFQYESSYLARPHAYALDPALELVSGSQQVFAGLPGAFSDSAPDRWGRRLIAARERAAALDESRRPHALDDADFLTGVSDATRQGALRFRTDDDPVFLGAGHGVPKLLSLPRLLHAARSSDTTLTISRVRPCRYVQPMSLESPPDEKRMRLRYAGTCHLCSAALPAGEPAIYDRVARRVRRISCATDAEIDPGAAGSAGASARREYERRKSVREKKVRERYPKLGGLILALFDDPQSTMAWERGAIGE